MAVLQNQTLVARYGGVITDAQGTVRGFVPAGPAAAGYHFVGVQMAHPSVFAHLTLNEPAESTRLVYRELIAARPGSIRAFLASGSFYDVGTPSDYLDAALAIARTESFPSPQIGAGSRVAGTARIVDSVLWDNVSVGAGARLERCVVADGVTIPARAELRNRAIIQERGDLVMAEMRTE
jgi:NDP-sugar pyrophosphorylase family protein